MLRKIEENMQTQRNDIDKMKDTIISDINKNIDSKFEDIERKFSNLEKQIEDQQTSLERMEQHIKKRNIIFFGFEEKEKSYHELEGNLVRLINENMKIPCERRDIELVKRIGRQTTNRTNHVRPVVLTAGSMGLKIEIMKNKKLLEQSQIYIKEDFTQKVLKKRKELQVEFKARKEQGEKVALRYDRIIILNQPKESETPVPLRHLQPQGSTNINNKRKTTFSPRKENPQKSKQRSTAYSVTSKNSKPIIESFMKSRGISQASTSELEIPIMDNE